MRKKNYGDDERKGSEKMMWKILIVKIEERKREKKNSKERWKRKTIREKIIMEVMKKKDKWEERGRREKNHKESTRKRSQAQRKIKKDKRSERK